MSILDLSVDAAGYESSSNVTEDAQVHEGTAQDEEQEPAGDPADTEQDEAASAEADDAEELEHEEEDIED